MKKKLTPEEKEQLQAMLDKQSMERAKTEQKLSKQRKSLIARMAGASPLQDVASSSARGRGQELARRMRMKRVDKRPVLKQMKLTEEEKKELAAKIRGTK